MARLPRRRILHIQLAGVCGSEMQETQEEARAATVVTAQRVKRPVEMSGLVDRIEACDSRAARRVLLLSSEIISGRKADCMAEDEQ